MGREGIYIDQFHLFSIFEQQMGVISILISLKYNVSPFGFSTFPRVNRIECRSWEEEKTKNCLEWLNYEPYCIFPSRTNSCHFYDPIGVFMNEVCKNQFQTWYDLIPHLSLNIKQHVRMVTIFIHISSKPSLTCYIITAKKAQLIRSTSGCIGFMPLINTCLIG